ncbi:hypothetical protein RclHR1_00030031 [Rhizophagus clarus]|uniref:Sel1 repeat family protein n=1 Tax=Rhizophagus clarus TaxID=94130 RepID=A0A2Z6RHD4_9GLOM|nr:hypothetical protein RclHR1_00030031 [Rhizophagus clarus]GES92279.1 Sel1 repeat family protein [Rhizophagus clarus]
MSSNNDLNDDEMLLREFLKEFYRQMLTIEDYIRFKDKLIEWMKTFLKINKKTYNVILKLMEDHEEIENWFSSLIGFFYENGIGINKIDENKSLEFYFLAINIKNRKLISVYQILNIIIAKYLISFHYYKDIIISKRLLISKEFNHIKDKNLTILSQIQFENFNGLEINLYKDEITTIEKYFRTIDKGFKVKNDQTDYNKRREMINLNNLAYSYQYGMGKEKNENKAFECYLKAAKEGNVNAQNNLGYCYQNGIGTEKNESKALECYLKAAKEGEANAQYNLGCCHQNGIGVNENIKKAFEWYLKSAEKKLPIAQFILGNCYKNGIGIKKDENRAGEYYLRAAKGGNSDAVNMLGDHYKNVEKDLKKAFEWYLKSARNGNSDAQVKLGDYYHKFKTQRNRHLKEAVYWYDRAVKKGNVMAQYNLGCCFLFGIGINKDSVKAFELFKEFVKNVKAFEFYEKNPPKLRKIVVEKYHRDALDQLGSLYKSKSVINKDNFKPFQIIKELAEEDYLNTLFQLGYYYSNGIGTEINNETAFELYKIAAERGLSVAQSSLGNLYENGIGVEKSFNKAFYWYNKSAVNNNNEVVQYKLGQYYELGIGVDKSLAQAFYFYKKSNENGFFESNFQLGYCYVNGYGTKIRRKKGFELYNKTGKSKNFNVLLYKNVNQIHNDLDKINYLYHKLADDDNGAILYELGEFYESGKGVQKNEIRAFAFYKQSAEKGYIVGKCKLAYRYENGIGTYIDKGSWFN